MTWVALDGMILGQIKGREGGLPVDATCQPKKSENGLNHVPDGLLSQVGVPPTLSAAVLPIVGPLLLGAPSGDRGASNSGPCRDYFGSSFEGMRSHVCAALLLLLALCRGALARCAVIPGNERDWGRASGLTSAHRLTLHVVVPPPLKRERDICRPSTISF